MDPKLLQRKQLDAAQATADGLVAMEKAIRSLEKKVRSLEKKVDTLVAAWMEEAEPEPEE